MAGPTGLTKNALQVGLFSVTPAQVYLGAPPGETAPGLELSPQGLQRVGSQTNTTFWPWENIRVLHVVGAPVKSGPARGLAVAGIAVSLALTWWSVSAPDPMTVVLETDEGSSELTVDSNAAIAYTPRQAELSQALLNHFADGSLSPSLMTKWRENTPEPRRLSARSQEKLLFRWAQN